ncbi:MAG: hypothetical protein ABI333_10305 [bacterium]
MSKVVMAASAAVLILGLAQGAQARGGYASLPKLGSQDGTLRIKIVGYQGGKMHVKVRNIGRSAREFRADGLYFVPEGDPDKAPQRMGAAGPLEVAEGGRWKHRRALQVGAGKTVSIKLQVFCLDSHRSSPRDGQGFSVAHKRLPKRLRQEIVSGTDGLYRRAKRRAPKSAVQSYIWKTRNKRWIKLQGERKAEKSGRHQRLGQQRRYRRIPRRYRRPLRQQQQQ